MANQRTNEFLSNFGKAKTLIFKRIEDLKSDDKELNAKLTLISNDIQQINSSLHDATLFLPSYSIKVRQDEIRELEKALKEKEVELVPRKKFGFKSKPQQTTKLEPGLVELTADAVSHEPVPVPTTKADDANFLTIENLSSAKVTYESSNLTNNDVLVRDLVSCTAYLNGSPSSLRLVNLRKSKLICGPVFTSIFVDNCEDCTLFLCCQQLRVHSSKSLDMYIRVRSRAIIEDCNQIRFGPYTWNHPDSSKLHKLTGIDEDVVRFDNIDDFNWLAFSTQSPHWSLIPAQEQVLDFNNLPSNKE